MSQITLATPFLALGVLGAVITTGLSAYIAPASLRTLKSLRTQILLQEANTRIKPHTFITSFPNLLLYVQNVDPKTNDWLGVFLLQSDPAKRASRLLTAERGLFRIESGESLTLEAQLFNGYSVEYGEQRPEVTGAQYSSQSTAAFTKSTVRLADQQAALGANDKEPGSLAEMTMKELSELATKAATVKEKRQALAEIHKRFAFPFACLTLTAMTFVLAIQGRRFSTRPRTVIVILFLAMGFYLLLVMGQNLALSGAVPGWLGVWLSNFIYGGFILGSFISNRTPWARLISFLNSPSSASDTSRPNEPAPINQDFHLTGARTAVRSKGNRVISLNLINYLLISEIVKYFLLATSTLVATSTIFTLFDLIPSIIKSGTSLSYAASYLAYLAPQLAYYVAPFSLLVALLMSFSVLSKSNQLVIIAGAGQSRARILTAVLMTAGALTIILWLLSNYLLPYTNREQDERYSKIKGRQIEQTTIAFGSKWVFGKDDSIYSYQRIDPDDSLINTSIYRLNSLNGLIQSVTHFSKASRVEETVWKAESGWVETFNADSTIERKAIEAPINISEDVSLFRRTTNESSKMSAWRLQEHISQLEELGAPTLELKIDLKKRIAFPFSCLVLAILAIPFITVKQARRSGPLISISLSVGIGLVFWLLATLFEAVGKQDNLPAGMAVWGPHILFGSIGVYLSFVRNRAQ